MNPKNNRARGKQAEKHLAKMTGGFRVGLLGATDVITNVFSWEVKSRIRSTVTSWVDQSSRNCQKGKIPAVFLHIKNKPYEQGLVILRWQDFKAIVDQ